MSQQDNSIIIYNTPDGKSSVALYARDGSVWMSQNQLAELFDTSKPNISMHIANILKENELRKESVVKDYLTTASDGKQYKVTFYSLDMILAIGFRVRSKRGTQFRQWANQNLKEFMIKGKCSAMQAVYPMPSWKSKCEKFMNSLTNAEKQPKLKKPMKLTWKS